MRNISVNQLIMLIIICLLLFGDFSKLKKKLKIILKSIFDYFNVDSNDTDNRKKGN